jgi:hypothetical protein
MLARQRLPQAVLQHVSNGLTTLLSTTPPTTRQQGEPSALVMDEIHQVFTALCDAVVLVVPISAAMEEIAVIAHRRGIATFAFGGGPRMILPAGMRRLRPGKSGVRSLFAQLGVHQTSDTTVQQERLF